MVFKPRVRAILVDVFLDAISTCVSAERLSSLCGLRNKLYSNLVHGTILDNYFRLGLRAFLVHVPVGIGPAEEHLVDIPWSRIACRLGYEADRSCLLLGMSWDKFGPCLTRAYLRSTHSSVWALIIVSACGGCQKMYALSNRVAWICLSRIFDPIFYQYVLKHAIVLGI